MAPKKKAAAAATKGKQKKRAGSGNRKTRDEASGSREQLLEKQAEALREQLRKRELETGALSEVQADLTSTKAALAASKEELRAAQTERDEWAQRSDVLRGENKQSAAQVRALTADNEALAKQVKELKTGLDWERKFKEGHEKAKAKLAKKLAATEHALAQQKEFAGVAHGRLEAEQKEVHRERAQRLLDLHKIKLAEVERDDMRLIAVDKVEVAKAATKNEGHVRGIVEPLRTTLRAYEEVSREDSAAVSRMTVETSALRDLARKLQENLEYETSAHQQKAEMLMDAERGLSQLKAQVYRLVKAHPMVASFVPELADALAIVASKRNAGRTGKSGKSGKFGKPTKDGKEGMGRDGGEMAVPALDASESAPLKDDHAAWKFAAFLRDCDEQLLLAHTMPRLSDKSGGGGRRGRRRHHK